MEIIEGIIKKLRAGERLSEAEKIKYKRHTNKNWIMEYYAISEEEACKLALEWVQFEHDKTMFMCEGEDIFGKKIKGKLQNILDFMIARGYIRDDKIR